MSNGSDVQNLTDISLPSTNSTDGDIDRAVVLTTLITVSLISIIMHILFLKAIRSYCSWDSGFSFTLLFLISFNALLYFLGQLIALLIASSNLDEDHYHRVYRILGTLLLIPYFIMVALHVFLALHRFFYTVLPVQAKRLLRRPILKGCITFLIFYYITLFVLTQSDYMGTIFDPEYLFNFVLDLPYARVLVIMDTVSTYANLIINIPVYVSIFVILYIRKNISCRTSNEIQMTAQTSFMVALELFFSYFWSFFNRDLTEMEGLLAQVTTMLYFDSVIVPYVIFNRNVRQNVFLCWKKRASRVRNEIRVVPRRSMITSFSHIRHS